MIRSGGGGGGGGGGGCTEPMLPALWSYCKWMLDDVCHFIYRSWEFEIWNFDLESSLVCHIEAIS